MASKLQSMSRLFAEFSSSPALAPLHSAAAATAPSSSQLASSLGGGVFAASSGGAFGGGFGGEGEGDIDVEPLAASAPSVLDSSYNSLGAGMQGEDRRGERPRPQQRQQQQERDGAGASVGGQQLRSLSSFLPEHSPEREEEGGGIAPLLASSYPPPPSSSLMGGGLGGVGAQEPAQRG